MADRPEIAVERAAALADALATHDAADPVDPGLPIEAARRAAGLPDPRLIEPMLRLAKRAENVLAFKAVSRGALAQPVPTVPQPLSGDSLLTRLRLLPDLGDLLV